MRIVILGGGFGGVYTAQNLASCRPFGEKLHVTVISRSPHFEFKPLFPEVFAGRLAPDYARFRLQDMCPDCHVQIAEVTGLAPEREVVNTNRGHVRYDYLVIALGGTPILVPTAADFEPLSFESLDDVIRLRELILRLAGREDSTRKRGARAKNKVVIVGAGPTGIELACEISHLFRARHMAGKAAAKKSEVYLIEAAPEILYDWGQALREQVSRFLNLAGVRLLTGEKVNKIEKSRVRLSGNRSVSADIVVWAGGLKGLPLYRAFQIALDENGRFRVDRHLEIPRYDNIFAMGDAINTAAFATAVPRSAQAAYQQAECVANNIRRSIAGKSIKEFRYFETGVAMPVGGRRAIARILGAPLEGHIAWAIEKGLFVARIPGLRNKLRLLDGLALDPLAQAGSRFLQERGFKWNYPAAESREM